jgi:uncharacterized membrane protein YdjX (TVP38/TMEM64 family)
MIKLLTDIVDWFKDIFTAIDDFYLGLLIWVDEFIKVYANWGIFAWLFAAWLESIFPLLPLTGIAIANIKAAQFTFGSIFGWLFGFLITYIGTTLGAITMFVFWRYVSDKIKYFRIKKKNKLNDVPINHESSHGIIALFSMTMIPFFPSSVINFSFAFTKMKTSIFIKTTIIAKFIMVFLLSVFAGFFNYLMQDTVRLSIAIVVIAVISLLLNRFETQIVNFIKKLLGKSRLLRAIEKHNEEN